MIQEDRNLLPVVSVYQLHVSVQTVSCTVRNFGKMSFPNVVNGDNPRV